VLCLAIDPGIETGWALFDGRTRRLLACGAGERWPGPVARVLIERPQVYSARLSKGNPNDLITLAIRVGRYLERLGALGVPIDESRDTVLPNAWKGQVPKGVHNRRVLGGLDPEDRATADRCLTPLANGLRDDAIDAIGLGVWAFERGRWP
jgi:hypothetical protein